MEAQYPVDAAVLMLGTNDCKAYYHNSPYIIAKGLSQCVDELLRYIKPEKILIVSPIHLGEDVWKEQFDPEFNQKSVEISMGLEKEYKKNCQAKAGTFFSSIGFCKSQRQ